MRSIVGSWRHKFLVMAAAVALSAPLAVGADGWAWLPGSSQQQKQDTAQSLRNTENDDLQVTMAPANSDQDVPLVDVASKSKSKKTFWNNKIWHPTQWFSSSKSSKK
jgi:hypothetical protein